MPPTREDLIRLHGDMQIWCRGPRALDPDLLQQAEQKRLYYLSEELIPEGLEFAREMNHALRSGYAIPESCTLMDLDILLLRILDTRKGCGQPLTNILTNGPWDGETHRTPCPRCGTEFRWTPAISDEEKALKDEKRRRRVLGVLR